MKKVPAAPGPAAAKASPPRTSTSTPVVLPRKKPARVVRPVRSARRSVDVGAAAGEGKGKGATAVASGEEAAAALVTTTSAGQDGATTQPVHAEEADAGAVGNEATVPTDTAAVEAEDASERSSTEEKANAAAEQQRAAAAAGLAEETSEAAERDATAAAEAAERASSAAAEEADATAAAAAAEQKAAAAAKLAEETAAAEAEAAERSTAAAAEAAERAATAAAQQAEAAALEQAAASAAAQQRLQAAAEGETAEREVTAAAEAAERAALERVSVAAADAIAAAVAAAEERAAAEDAATRAVAAAAAAEAAGPGGGGGGGARRLASRAGSVGGVQPAPPAGTSSSSALAFACGSPTHGSSPLSRCGTVPQDWRSSEEALAVTAADADAPPSPASSNSSSYGEFLSLRVQLSGASRSSGLRVDTAALHGADGCDSASDGASSARGAAAESAAESAAPAPRSGSPAAAADGDGDEHLRWLSPLHNSCASDGAAHHSFSPFAGVGTNDGCRGEDKVGEEAENEGGMEGDEADEEDEDEDEEDEENETEADEDEEADDYGSLHARTLPAGAAASAIAAIGAAAAAAAEAEGSSGGPTPPESERSSNAPSARPPSTRLSGFPSMVWRRVSGADSTADAAAAATASASYSCAAAAAASSVLPSAQRAERRRRIADALRRANEEEGDEVDVVLELGGEYEYACRSGLCTLLEGRAGRSLRRIVLTQATLSAANLCDLAVRVGALCGGGGPCELHVVDGTVEDGDRGLAGLTALLLALRSTLAVLSLEGTRFEGDAQSLDGEAPAFAAAVSELRLLSELSLGEVGGLTCYAWECVAAALLGCRALEVLRLNGVRASAAASPSSAAALGSCASPGGAMMMSAAAAAAGGGGGGGGGLSTRAVKLVAVAVQQSDCLAEVDLGGTDVHESPVAMAWLLDAFAARYSDDGDGGGDGDGGAKDADDDDGLRLVVEVDEAGNRRCVDDGWSPLFYACLRNAAEEAEEAVTCRPEELTSRDRHGRTPLHVCAAANSAATLEVLLEALQEATRRYGLRVVNTVDGAGMTPLQAATSRCHTECTALLLRAGAVVDAPALESAVAVGIEHDICVERRRAEHRQQPGGGGAFGASAAAGAPDDVPHVSHGSCAKARRLVREQLAMLSPHSHLPLRKVALKTFLPGFLAYTVFLLFITYATGAVSTNFGSEDFLSTKSVRDRMEGVEGLMDVADENLPDLQHLSTIPELWEWCDAVLLGVMSHAIQDDGFDVVGSVRLRQVRVVPSACDASSADDARGVSLSGAGSSAGGSGSGQCYGVFSEQTQETAPLSLESEGGTGRTWEWRAYEDEPVPVESQLGLEYGPGGYTEAISSSNVTKARRVISRLKDAGWLDYATRAMYVDLTFYKKNTHRYIACHLLFEFSQTGDIVHSLRLTSIVKQTTNFGALLAGMLVCTILLFWDECEDIRVSVLPILSDTSLSHDGACAAASPSAAVATPRMRRKRSLTGGGAAGAMTPRSVLVHAVAGKAKAQRWRRWAAERWQRWKVVGSQVSHQFGLHLLADWNAADYAIIVMLVLAMKDMIVLANAFAEIDERVMAVPTDYVPGSTQASYVSFAAVSSATRRLRDTCGLMVVLSWAKSLKHFAVLPVAGPAVNAIILTIVNPNILTFMMLFLTISFSLAVGLHFTLGNNVGEFSTPTDAGLAFFRMVFGDFDVKSFTSHTSVVGVLLFVTCLLTANFILMNILIAVVGMHYEEQIKVSQQEWQIDMIAALKCTLRPAVEDEYLGAISQHGPSAAAASSAAAGGGNGAASGGRYVRRRSSVEAISGYVVGGLGSLARAPSVSVDSLKSAVAGAARRASAVVQTIRAPLPAAKPLAGGSAASVAAAVAAAAGGTATPGLRRRSPPPPPLRVSRAVPDVHYTLCAERTARAGRRRGIRALSLVAAGGAGPQPVQAMFEQLLESHTHLSERLDEAHSPLLSPVRAPDAPPADRARSAPSPSAGRREEDAAAGAGSAFPGRKSGQAGVSMTSSPARVAAVGTGPTPASAAVPGLGRWDIFN